VGRKEERWVVMGFDVTRIADLARKAWIDFGLVWFGLVLSEVDFCVPFFSSDVRCRKRRKAGARTMRFEKKEWDHADNEC
jgi:hypothetical protein